RRPDAMPACPIVISQCVNRFTVEIRSANFPTFALQVRLQDEGSFSRSHQQKKVSLPDPHMPHIVQIGRPGDDSLRTAFSRNDGACLNRCQRRLNFRRGLVSLRRFLDQTTLNYRPQAWREGRSQWRWYLTKDGRADFEAGLPFERQAT